MSEVVVTRCGVKVMATEVVGAFALTPCCDAAATGTTEGIACKGCYQPVPGAYAAATIDGVLELAGCPCAWDCARHTEHLLGV